jgi:hypothetical protein
MFGGLSLSPGGAELPAEIAHIARDPMDPEFDDDLFVDRVRRRTSGVKRILLDQTLISGVGNIYADEALWLATLHGDRPGDRLGRAEVVALLAGVRTVMAAALAQGGTSFDALYVNVNGESGMTVPGGVRTRGSPLAVRQPMSGWPSNRSSTSARVSAYGVARPEPPRHHARVVDGVHARRAPTRPAPEHRNSRSPSSRPGPEQRHARPETAMPESTGPRTGSPPPGLTRGGASGILEEHLTTPSRPPAGPAV